MRGISAFVALLLRGASAVMPGIVRAQVVGMGLILIAISERVPADDGIGFNPAARAYGSGLQGIEDRLGTHGGRLAVVSAPGAGTVIRGWLPVAAAAEAAA